MSEVLVSIIISAYNEEKYIQQSVDSILNQTYSNFELIIFDDGSIDKTAKIISAYNDKRIQFISDGKNKNQAVRANEGIQLAKGKYIARMDADDISLPHRLQKQVQFLESHPEIDIIGGQIKTINSDASTIYKYKHLPTEPTILKAYSLFFCPFIHSTVMARAHVFKDNSYNPEFTVAQDYHLFTQILSKYNGANLSDVVVHYRVHEGNVHQQDSDRLLSFVKQIFLERFKLEGIVVTDENITAQLLISESSKTNLSKSDLSQIEDWLNKMVQINAEIHFVEEKALRESFTYVWKEMLWKIKKDWLLDYLRKAANFSYFSKLNRSDFGHLFRILLN